MALWTGNSLLKHVLLLFSNDRAVLRVHTSQGSDFCALLESLKELVVVNHEDALVGHEELEGVNA